MCHIASSPLGNSPLFANLPQPRIFLAAIATIVSAASLLSLDTPMERQAKLVCNSVLKNQLQPTGAMRFAAFLTQLARSRLS